MEFAAIRNAAVPKSAFRKCFPIESRSIVLRQRPDCEFVGTCDKSKRSPLASPCSPGGSSCKLLDLRYLYCSYLRFRSPLQQLGGVVQPSNPRRPGKWDSIT